MRRGFWHRRTQRHLQNMGVALWHHDRAQTFDGIAQARQALAMRDALYECSCPFDYWPAILQAPETWKMVIEAHRTLLDAGWRSEDL